MFEPSDEQKAVIRHRGGHLQVIACAGSGKTEAISRRIAELLIEGHEPREILAFTFTERAAASMKARVVQRVGEALGVKFLGRLNPMYVGTIHAFCLRVLQENVPEYANYDILDPHRLAALLSREFKSLGLESLGDRHWGSIQSFLETVDLVENELMPTAQFKGTPFGQIYSRYLEMLARFRFLTYGQLIVAAVRALEDPGVHARVHGPLRHLFVDEYQDVNPGQERLVQLLGDAPVHVCVVGDDDQAIYQWRGSDVASIQTFPSRYANAAKKPLSTNRRSRPEIVRRADRFARSIRQRLPKTMGHHRSPGSIEVHSWSAERAEDEAERIASAIDALRTRGYRYRDVGILLRSVRTSSAPIIEALRRHDIPIRCSGRTGLFLQPEAQVMGKTFAWLVENEWQPEAFGERGRIELEPLLDAYRQVFRLSKPQLGRLRRQLVEWRDAVRSEARPARLVGEYYEILDVLGCPSWDLSDPVVAARMGGLARFSQLLADYEHVKRRARWIDGEYRGGQDRGVWLYRNLFNYLQFYARDAYEDFPGEDGFDLDAVDLLTVHQAKGLEWPVVFVPCLVKTRFPSSRTGQARHWLVPAHCVGEETRRRYEGSEADERRLFYVAMTRARDALYLSRFRRKKNRFQPSPFLVEIAGADPPEAKTLPLPDAFIPEKSEREKPSVSFSDLAHYENCPLSFRLESLLGFQPQVVAELGYGKAIHHILRRIADRAREEGRIPGTQEIDRIFDDDFYLPFANRITYQELRLAAGRLVGKYVDGYQDDLFRVWDTERPFELHLDNGIVTGRADVILDGEGGAASALALVDYKTGANAFSDDIFAFQLAVYAAAGQGEGLDVRAAYLHDLKAGDRKSVPVKPADTQRARKRAQQLVTRMIDGQFEPRPDKGKCGRCDVRQICRHGPG